MNRPYGGFPWITLPPVLFETFANAHNGYGDFVDLEDATLEDAQGFFDRYYAPGNAVLTVAGDVDPAEVLRAGRAALRRHPGPRGAGAAELRRARRPPASGATCCTDRLAPRPPSPSAGASRTRPTSTPTCPTSCSPRCSPTATPPACSERLVHARPDRHQRRRLPRRHGRPARRARPHAAAARGAPPARGAGRHGARAPSTRSSTGSPPAGCSPASWSAPWPGCGARYLRDIDPVLGRALAMSVLEQQRGRAELVNEVPGLLADVSRGGRRPPPAPSAGPRRARDRARRAAVSTPARHHRRAARPRARQASARRSCPPSPSAPSATGCACSPCAGPGVPLVELRLRVPFAAPGRCDARARAQLLGDTLLSGTDRRTPASSRPTCRPSAAGCRPAPTPTGWAWAARCSPAACPGCWSCWARC